MAPTVVSSVTVAAAAPKGGGGAFDLISLADVKLELQITDASNDAWLAKSITRVSSAIARYCNRVFQPQTYQDRFWALRDPFPWQLPSGFFPLQLEAWPIASAPSPAGTPPPLSPTLSSVSGGALQATTYYVKVSYVTAAGETAASMETSLAVAPNNLLQVTSPIPDALALATGWNVYIGNASFGEVRQNAVPLAIGANFTLPTTGLQTTGQPLPPYILAVENAPLVPTPLGEGVDFISDYDGGTPSVSKGWLTRLFPLDASPRQWTALPILVIYQAGYPQIPDDLVDAAMMLVKERWFSRVRDPKLRAENVEGAWSAQYWFASGPGNEHGFPPDIQQLLDMYRVPVLG